MILGRLFSLSGYGFCDAYTDRKMVVKIPIFHGKLVILI